MYLMRMIVVVDLLSWILSLIRLEQVAVLSDRKLKLVIRVLLKCAQL